MVSVLPQGINEDTSVAGHASTLLCYVRMENEWKKKRREEVLMGRVTLIKTNETLSES